MINLKDPRFVKGLQSNLRTVFDGAQGKEVMKFLENLCGWYDFSENDLNTILIKTGKRQVLATIKTLLELPPEQIVEIAKAKEL